MDGHLRLRILHCALALSTVILQAVGQAPSVTVDISPSPVEVGSSVTLNCSYTLSANQNMSRLTWANTGTYNADIFSMNTTHRDMISSLSSRFTQQSYDAGHVITISRAELADEGSYECTVVDDSGNTGSASGNLVVQYLSSDLSIEVGGKEYTTETCDYTTAVDVVLYTTWTGDIKCLQKDAKPKVALSWDVNNHTTGNYTSSVKASTDTVNSDGTTTTEGTLSMELVAVDSFYTVTCTATHDLRSQSVCVVIKAEDPGACSSDPCLNGGTCTKAGSGYTCACAPDYTGTNCDATIDNCVGDPCKNGATCTDGIGSFTCACTSCYNGTTCENKKVNHCENHDCNNGATCVDTCNGFLCTCDYGFRGDKCEIACGIDIRVTPTSAVLGDPVSFLCTTNISNPKSITWKSGATKLSLTAEYNISAVSAANSQVFCEVIDQTDCKDKKSAALDVNYELRPNSTETKNITLHKGEDEELPCSAMGKPTPKIIWFFTPKPKRMGKEDANVTTPAPLTMDKIQLGNGSDSSNTLELDDVKKEDEGIYTCIARLAGFQEVTLKVYHVRVAPKKGLKAWQIALIVLGCLLILALLIILVILLLKKLGKTPAICPSDKSTAVDGKSGGKKPLPGDNRYSDKTLEGAEGNPGSNYFRLPEVAADDRASNGYHEMDEKKNSKSSRYQNDGEDDRDSLMNSAKPVSTPRALPDMPDVKRGGGRALPPLDLEAERQQKTPRKKKKKSKNYEDDEDGENARDNEDEYYSHRSDYYNDGR